MVTGLLGGIFARGDVAAQVGDRALLQAMLDAEAGLARASAAAGLFDVAVAEAIAAACDASLFDIDELGAAAAASASPVVPLVRALTAAVQPASAAAQVHRGATSQDILDTALSLVSARALDVLLVDLTATADACASLARTHRDTVCVGRSLMQQALPTTFGLKAAGWLTALDTALVELSTVRRGLAVQLGGAVGTLASLGPAGVQVLSEYAVILRLAEPTLAWHTDRTGPALLASRLGVLGGVLGKLAGDVLLLAQTEIAEVREGFVAGQGGSSTMPHKRNQIGAVSVRACVGRIPGLVATMLSAMPQELERSAGWWQAEWDTLRDLLRLTGSACAWAREMVEGLHVDAERMRHNLDLTGGLLMTEAIATSLTPSLGRLQAHELVEAACASALRDGVPLRSVLASQLSPALLDAALDPAQYLGSAGAFVDRALAAHAALEAS